MAISQDPNDPNFGLETDPSSPNFGLATEPSKEQGGILQHAGAAALNVAKGFVKGLLPRPLSIKEIAFPIVGGQVENIMNLVTGVEQAEKTPPYSQERFEAGFNVAGQLGLAALGGRAGLREIALGEKPVAPTEAAPKTPVVPIPETVQPEPFPSILQSAENQRRAELGGEINAEQIREPTQADVNVQYAQGTQPREISGGEMPANIGGEGVPPRGQGETLQQTPQEVAPAVPSEQPAIDVPTPVTRLEQLREASLRTTLTPSEKARAAKMIAEEERNVAAGNPGEPLRFESTAVPQPEQPVAETPPTPAETQAASKGDTVGIAAKYREEQQPGSVIPGVGRTPEEARAWGHDFINKGGNPYDVIANKGPKRELWQDVGVARAEYERLSNEKRVAEDALDQDPNNPSLQQAFDNADAAQRKWSKDAQPILTRAGDALRAATRSYPREINSFSDFTDLVNDHYNGEVELTPAKRAEVQKAVKQIKNTNKTADGLRAQVTDQAVKRAGGKIMSFEDLRADLQGTVKQLLEDCVL